MASASVREGHIYDPISDETITDSEGFVEVIITPRTQWSPICDPDNTISNDEYEMFLNDPAVIEDCDRCRTKALEIDPEGFIFDF